MTLRTWVHTYRPERKTFTEHFDTHPDDWAKCVYDDAAYSASLDEVGREALPLRDVTRGGHQRGVIGKRGIRQFQAATALGVSSVTLCESARGVVKLGERAVRRVGLRVQLTMQRPRHVVHGHRPRDPVPPPKNEPVRAYAPGSREREQLAAELDRQAAEVVEIPCLVGGREVRTGRTEDVVLPHAHRHVVADAVQRADGEERADARRVVERTELGQVARSRRRLLSLERYRRSAQDDCRRNG